MRSWCLKIYALLSVLVMVPGALELLENTAHLLREGHAAHAAATADEHGPTDPEHGCTPTFHLCVCHASQAFLTAPKPLAIDLAVLGFPPQGELLAPLEGFRPSLERPPRA